MKVDVTRDVQISMDRYLSGVREAAETGEMTLAIRDEMRSCACEAIAALVRGNPDAFGEHRDAMAAIWRRQHTGQPEIGNPWRDRSER